MITRLISGRLVLLQLNLLKVALHMLIFTQCEPFFDPNEVIVVMFLITLFSFHSYFSESFFSFSRPPPKLTDQSAWSSHFHDFLAQCLIKNPDARPSASALLKHPFILKADEKRLLPLLEENDKVIKEAGGREIALQLYSDDDSEEYEDSEDEISEEESGSGSKGEEESSDLGTSPFGATMIRLPDSGEPEQRNAYMDAFSPNTGQPAFLENLLDSHKTQQKVLPIFFQFFF